MKFEETINISAKPEMVFSTYADVSNWPLWDPETESASLDGEFAAGTSGKIKPKGAPESKILLAEVTQDRAFTVECKLPLCKMLFVHIMESNYFPRPIVSVIR